MPAQFGFHPALAWPLPFGEARGEHRITFDADEPERLLRIAPDGLIAPERRDSPLEGRTLHLDDELFHDAALVWDPVHSDKVRYGDRKSVVSGKRVSVRVVLGGRRTIKKKNYKITL